MFFCLYVSAKRWIVYNFSFAHIFVFLWLQYSIWTCWLAACEGSGRFLVSLFLWAHMALSDTFVWSMKACSEIFQGPWFFIGVSFPCAVRFPLAFFVRSLFHYVYIVYICNRDPVTPNYWVLANLADLWYTFVGDWEHFSRICRFIPSFVSKLEMAFSRIFKIRATDASSISVIDVSSPEFISTHWAPSHWETPG